MLCPKSYFRGSVEPYSMVRSVDSLCFKIFAANLICSAQRGHILRFEEVEHSAQIGHSHQMPRTAALSPYRKCSGSEYRGRRNANALADAYRQGRLSGQKKLPHQVTPRKFHDRIWTDDVSFQTVHHRFLPEVKLLHALLRPRLPRLPKRGFQLPHNSFQLVRQFCQ